MNQKQKKDIRKMLTSVMTFDEPLAKHTTFGIGGPADCMVFPETREELSKLLKYAYQKKISAIFIGSGSNILVWDKGFDGIVISLKKSFKNLTIKRNSQIIVEAGVMLGTMVKQAMAAEIGGLESLIGVPGTVGGALIMNAGAFGSEISKYFEEAKTMTIEGDTKSYKKGEIEFSYRHSTFPKNEILLEATFQCKRGKPAEILKDRKVASDGRKSNQPLKFRSAGSIFKNPSDSLAAGYLIDKTGLKGTERGGAAISEKHANFIVNMGDATAADVLYLIKLAKKYVAKKFHINLELEVKLIGFPKSMTQDIYYA
ncbi:MAG TPA: UDP-N-acetylmuramate dehydrogenase [Candidatus Marinimicrobia bacterium]|nr:UDP-N-acetylmuramate dehydrogenase [Candidatus Neomarinimicrobiota bacterium]HIB15024.1 UDP-N-acetylmuramate dehydrogenase [Candidatus Neomarinimicrobiota bacterium]HIG51303.1 UDP-N-acetylmuramate dehydrogenase [Candidatus Neomarinimicrobiota bacterium]HIM53226.1 UDP-N-acetylmuramate dehydrogenase [Candidatus Neomarinimicrobiota bacterium]